MLTRYALLFCLTIEAAVDIRGARWGWAVAYTIGAVLSVFVILRWHKRAAEQARARHDHTDED